MTAIYRTLTIQPGALAETRTRSVLAVNSTQTRHSIITGQDCGAMQIVKTSSTSTTESITTRTQAYCSRLVMALRSTTIRSGTMARSRARAGTDGVRESSSRQLLTLTFTT